MAIEPYWAIQPAFTGGEISGDVASRVDLDKYQIALLQAENAIIRPYGAVRKRPGLLYCGSTKDGGKVRLYPFHFTTELAYLLEFGAGYVRVWRGGQYLGVELATPYALAELPLLHFVQSVDVLYICSGAHPVMKLMRYGDTDWRLEEISWSCPAFGDVNKTDDSVAPSGTTGTVTLTATGDVFDASRVGDYIQLEQRVSGQSVGTDVAIPCNDTWKIVTHGTWRGMVYVMVSYDDGATWKTLRSYSGVEDYNPMESGSVNEKCLIKATQNTNASVTLSTYSSVWTGYARITAVTDGKTATAEVIEDFGDTSGTLDWCWGAWSAVNGYPKCAAFFQDRLVFGGSTRYPQRVWMSRSGDYENFSVDKESGTVTDDSAITADLLSLEAYEIKHMVPGSDLLIFTEGNAWSISGAETVKPTNITPRQQESYGAADVPPMHIGARTVYVQRRGSTVRDTGYSYDTDSYLGMDLTLLAKHLVQGHKLKEAAYAQEPDSLLFFVRDDGVLLCLTYLVEQKVYGWSHIVTEGYVESVAAVNEGDTDRVYAVVRRQVNDETVRYVERFDEDHSESNLQEDYTMMDAAVRVTNEAAAQELTGLEHLEGCDVQVLAKGYYFEDLTVKDGKVTLPVAVDAATVGLPYKMVLEQPNFDAGMTESGTLQGQNKVVSQAVLRLSRSFGGKIGATKDALTEIIYRIGKMQLVESTVGENDVLYTGDLTAGLALGGYNTEGRVYIEHGTPYPFHLSAIIRKVSMHG